MLFWPVEKFGGTPSAPCENIGAFPPFNLAIRIMKSTDACVSEGDRLSMIDVRLVID